MRLFEWFDKIHYIVVCAGLASPLLLQPVLAPSVTFDDDKNVWSRYATKANIWIGIFSFIGNWWYTHYFYSVLGARYTFPSWDVNGVPIAMFFATHFYFCFYHALSNMVLRKIETTFKAGTPRTLFLVTIVCLMSYVTAYMETLTISSFECYNFSDREFMYSLGSAFYAIYFIVSFPMFYRVDNDKNADHDHTAFDCAIESLATGMMVLLLLDFVRVSIGEDLVFRLDRPCKLDASLSCGSFKGALC